MISIIEYFYYGYTEIAYIIEQRDLFNICNYTYHLYIKKVLVGISSERITIISIQQYQNTVCLLSTCLSLAITIFI